MKGILTLFMTYNVIRDDQVGYICDACGEDIVVPIDLTGWNEPRVRRGLPGVLPATCHPS